MKRTLLLMLAASACSGCHAPVPSFNVLAPYGDSRVAPPGTGSYGTANSYYQPSTGAPAKAMSMDAAPSPNSIVGDGQRSDAPNWRPVRLEPTVMSNDQAIGTGVARPGAAPPRTSTVVQASHTGAAPAGTEQPVRIAPSRSTTGAVPSGTGQTAAEQAAPARPDGARAQPVHDLTGHAAAPGRFVPASNARKISLAWDAPASTPSPTALRPTATQLPATTPPAPAQSETPPAQTTGLKWRSR